MAERGNPALLADEVRAAAARGDAQYVLRGGALPLSPGRVDLEFEVTSAFPFVTLVTMVAPSPDWFVGVHDLPLIEAGDWVAERRITLPPYDAGTDSGTTYVSRDLDTRPRQPDSDPIAMINPEIFATDGTTVFQEGCLSLPGEAEDVERAARVSVRFLDVDGKAQTLSCDGLLSIAVQHEIDHLDGIVFVDHLSSLKRELIRKRMKRLQSTRSSESSLGAP